MARPLSRGLAAWPRRAALKRQNDTRTRSSLHPAQTARAVRCESAHRRSLPSDFGTPVGAPMPAVPSPSPIRCCRSHAVTASAAQARPSPSRPVRCFSGWSREKALRPKSRCHPGEPVPAHSPGLRAGRAAARRLTRRSHDGGGAAAPPAYGPEKARSSAGGDSAGPGYVSRQDGVIHGRQRLPQHMALREA
jgi:hypothetical protein